VDTAAHVVVDDLDRLELAPDDAHHLGAVLRLRPGEAVGATDGRGGFLRCTWLGAGRLEPAADPLPVRPRPQPVGVAFAPVKGERTDWAVQKLAELGVDRIVLLLGTERGVVRWDPARAAAQLQRLGRVVRAAVAQSRQLWLPDVSAARWPEVAAGGRMGGPAGDAALAEPGGGPLLPGLASIVVGPEGGWSERERSCWPGPTVGLGPTVLRAETAAVAAGVLLSGLRDGRLQPGAGDLTGEGQPRAAGR
jgi:16S rRNA (uracil1498-N3)-methyltransferase